MRPFTNSLPTTIPAATLLPLALAALLPAQELSMEYHFGNRPDPRDRDAYEVAQWGPESLPSPGYAILAAKLLTVDGPPIDDGVILVENSKIIALGRRREITIPDGFEVLDHSEHWVVPGFVDLHCHVASPSFDLNDTVHATNPEFRTLDLITLEHDQIKDARAGGVTSVLYIPGSGSNMGGFGTLTKTHGDPREALIRFPGSLKIAQAGNPERRAGDLGLDYMGMNQGLRFMLQRGKEYHEAHEAWKRGEGPEPAFRPDLEYLRGLFRHEYPVSVHTQAYQVVLQTIRQLRVEFDLWTFVDHGSFDAFRLSGEAAAHGVPICNGPRQYEFVRSQSKFVGTAHAWYAGGEHAITGETVRGVGADGIAINTDAPVVPQEQLTTQCAVAVRLGLPWEVGMRALTINPARMAGIDHRVGSLTVGKDADLAVWTGDPLDPRHHVKLLLINGRIAYLRDEERPRF